VIRALVTGGCGFIGSALVRHLVGDRAACVVNVDIMTYPAMQGAVASVAHTGRYALGGDVCDRAPVQRLLEQNRPSWMFHLAAETHIDRSIDDPVVTAGRAQRGARPHRPRAVVRRPVTSVRCAMPTRGVP
jgi:dTDP-glucose 4,6-dehydratase